MANNIQSPGVQSILQSSSTGPGAWYRVHSKLSNLTFQVVHTGTSVGTTVGSTTIIQASNDGVNPLATVLGTIGVAGSDVASDGFTINAGWQYVRAQINSVQAATVGSTGTTFGVNVLVSAQLRN